MTHADDFDLVSERSVPVAGFSRELRLAEDVERFRFVFALRGEASVPVHVVFSAAMRSAEVKTGDMKALRLDGVESAVEARERWISWWEAGARGRPVFVGPRRTGRHPAAPPARP